MSSKPIKKALEVLEEDTNAEEALIDSSIIRIEQIRFSMLSKNIKHLNIKIINSNINDARKKIKKLKAQKKLGSLSHEQSYKN